VIPPAVAEQRLDDRDAPIGSDVDPLTVMLIGAALAIPSGALAILLAAAIRDIFNHSRRPGVVVIVVNTVISTQGEAATVGGERRPAVQRSAFEVSSSLFWRSASGAFQRARRTNAKVQGTLMRP
jgi:hypothetical protein